MMSVIPFTRYGRFEELMAGHRSYRGEIEHRIQV